MNADDDVLQIEPLDDVFDESWQRLTSEPHVRGVEVHHFRDPEDGAWMLNAWVMEYVREDPLESALRSAMDAALSAVRGVTGVLQEDREVWGIDGSPSGEELVVAAARVVDTFAEQTRGLL